MAVLLLSACNVLCFLSISLDSLVSSEEGMTLKRQWQEVQSSLNDYMQLVVKEWQTLAAADYTYALTQPLLFRHEDATIAVNFSPEV